MEFEILGQYKGIDVFVLTRDAFLHALDENERRTKANMWMIYEDKNLVHGGKVIGKIAGNNVHNVPALDYVITYGKYIRKETTVTKQQSEVMTERVTIDALCKKGSEMLRELSREAEDSYLNSCNDGTEMLEELYREGLKLTQEKG